MERFWRNIIGGHASSRFHRPGKPAKYGLGLNDLAQANIQSARMLTDAMNIFMAEPHNELFSNREANEAYCIAIPDKEYAVYFPKGGEVNLNISAIKNQKIKIRWLNILESKWKDLLIVNTQPSLKLTCPTSDYWAVLIKGL